MPSSNLGEVQRVTQEAEKKYGLPEGTLSKIAGIESGNTPTAVSPKGALGWFQFMPATAKQYGLKDPTNLVESADAAGRYMRDNIQKYGSMDRALADYNGGPKAVKALDAGKPWKETADYIAKFNGGKSPSVPLSTQFTTGERIDPTASASASELYQQQRQRDSESGGVVNFARNLPGALSKGFQADNSVYNYWKTQALANKDPNFQWTDEASKRFTADIPQDHWDYVLQAQSLREAEGRRGRVLEAMEREKELGQMGAAGMTGRIAAGLVDIPTLISFVPGLGGTGMLSTTSRISNAVRMGLIGAGTNLAYDAVANQYKPLATHDDLYISAAMGLELGALAGGAVNPRALAASRLAGENRELGQWGMRESGKAQIRELEDNGFKFTTKGEEFKKNLIDRPSLPEVKEPGIAILHPGEKPEAPRVFGGEKPVGDEPRVSSPPLAPREPEVGRKKPWGSEWDTPKFTTPMDAGRDLLVLPKVKRVSELAEYMREHSQNPDLVKVLDRVLKGIDLRKLEFKILERGEKFGDAGLDRIIATSRGAVLTPWNSDGDGIKMFLRGHSFAQNGMTEETLVHELVHAAAVYKQHTAVAGRATGMKVAPEVMAANDGMEELLRIIKTHESTFASTDSRLKTNLANEKELLAYGLTNSKFQEHLKGIPLPGSPDKSLWDRFVSSLRKLLGIGVSEHNALSRLIELSQPLTAKDGVKRVKDGLIAANSSVDADTIKAANEAGLNTVYGWGLGLEHRLGAAKVPTEIRSLASKLFGSTVGYKDHSVVKANAWDDTLKLADGWATEMRKGSYPAFEDWFKQSGRKQAEKGQAFDEFGTQVSDYIRGVKGDYPAQVQKAGEAIRKQLADVVDHINNPLKSEGGQKRGLTETEVLDPETGKTDIVGTLEKNPNYLPRKHDINKWNSIVNNFGRDAVEGWWARAYQKGRPDVSDEAATKWSKWYVNTVEEAHANRTQDLLEDIMRGHDNDALKNSLMLNGGFSEAEAKEVIEKMFPTKAKDSGSLMASLKHRNTIDETHSEKWITKSGEHLEIGLNDFVHSNAFDVVEPYLRRTASSVSLAKHLDVYKAGDIDNLIEKATRNELGSQFMQKAELDKYRKDLKFAFDRIQGLPQEDFTWWGKALSMWRNFNVIRLMGGTVWNQATELSQITGSMGWKSTIGAVRELDGLKRDIATGKAPHDFLDHLENTIGGAGAEYIHRLDFKNADDWVRHKGDTKFNQWLDATDDKLKRFAKGTLDYTGMTPLMIQQKRVHAVALVNHFINHANGAESKLLTPERLAWMGMDEQGTKDVLGALKKYSSPSEGQYSKATYKLDFQKWIKEDPESHSKFMTAVHRESRRVIQENDLASMVPIMGSTLGQTMFQFMNFTMHGWNKSMLFAMNHKDTTTMMTMLQGGFLASLAYLGRTQMESLGMDSTKRQEFLDKRLSTKQIVANSFGRTAQVSLLPNLFDTVSPVPLFSGMRTTSDLSSLASNPTYSAINGLLSMKKIVRNGLSDEYQTTEKDMKTWGKLVPLNNVFPVSTFLNSISNDYPKHEQQH